MVAAMVSRRDVLRFRFRRHQLDRPPDAAPHPTDVDLLDYGVQDTGPDGAAWALHLRGAPPAGPADLAFAWTLRGAPHAYRRQDLGAVATATAPLSEADAAKRIFDAAKPLKAAGIPVLEALDVVAGHLRDLAAEPIAKGDLSGRLTVLLDEPYLRFCRPCNAIHPYEMPFRLAALQAGLELEAGSSPPVLHRIPGLRPPRYRRLAGEADAPFHPIRNYLRFFGPARPADVAAYLDASQREVAAHWPADTVEVTVGDGYPGAGRAGAPSLLAEDLEALTDPRAGDGPAALRLLGPFDPYLQLRDRELLVADQHRRQDLWRVLGRPGAIVADGEVLGTWRPRATGRRLSLRIRPWGPLGAGQRAMVSEQAERLAAQRHATLADIVEEE